MAKVKIERELTLEEVADIAEVAASSIGYWADVHDLFRREYLEPLSDDVILFWITERGGGQGGRLDVTPTVIARGISLVLAGVTNEAAAQSEWGSAHWSKQPPGEWQFEPRQFADMGDLGAMDADEADWVVQLGLFGHLVFG